MSGFLREGLSGSASEATLQLFRGDFDGAALSSSFFLGSGLHAAGRVTSRSGQMAFAAATGVMVRAGSLGRTAMAARVASVADGATPWVRASLPPLPEGTVKGSFKNGQYSAVTFKAGHKFYRAEEASSRAPGRDLGLESVDTAAEAESAYFLAHWNNPMEVQRTYVLRRDVTVYFGKVEHGEGYQALIPFDLNHLDVLEWQATKTLD